MQSVKKKKNGIILYVQMADAYSMYLARSMQMKQKKKSREPV